ncbi:DNA mismatch repair protein MutL, partial [Klebsiella pneumoniae]|nr:DNA mismatch repair protein MutL [Klebsiella pneumoniae]
AQTPSNRSSSHQYSEREHNSNSHQKQASQFGGRHQFGESYQRTQGALYQKMMQESVSTSKDKEKIPLFPERAPLNLGEIVH